MDELTKIRFGHAFPHPALDDGTDPVSFAYDICAAQESLHAREPVDNEAVSNAEEALDISADRRPVYAYVGNLNPALGRVGLIIRQTWFLKEPHGMTRCDSGGLGGRYGGFSCLDHDSAIKALKELSFNASKNWNSEFDIEIKAAFDSLNSYLSGDCPDPHALDDVRGRCINHAIGADSLDRRLWTWEVRCYANIDQQDVEVVVLAPEAFKQFRYLCDEKGAPPSNVHILPATINHSHLSHFEEEAVLRAFIGDFSWHP